MADESIRSVLYIPSLDINRLGAIQRQREQILRDMKPLLDSFTEAGFLDHDSELSVVTPFNNGQGVDRSGDCSPEIV